MNRRLFVVAVAALIPLGAGASECGGPPPPPPPPSPGVGACHDYSRPNNVEYGCDEVAPNGLTQFRVVAKFRVDCPASPDYTTTRYGSWVSRTAHSMVGYPATTCVPSGGVVSVASKDVEKR